MAITTREVYQINQSTGERTYAGYAKFGPDDTFLGTAGGYGPGKKANNPKNGASRVQNVIVNSGARQAARRRRVGL